MGAAGYMAGRVTQQDVTPPVTLPSPAPTPASEFWREFLRVQSDKFILLALIAMLHFFHAPDSLQNAAVGGLIVLIQGQRFNLKKG